MARSGIVAIAAELLGEECADHDAGGAGGPQRVADAALGREDGVRRARRRRADPGIAAARLCLHWRRRWSPPGLCCWREPPSGTVTVMSARYGCTSLRRCCRVTGVVLQDVVADAMSTEVVPRVNADGTPRPQADIDRDLGMVQVLGRLALSAGSSPSPGLAGYLAQILPYHVVFLIGLIVPVISVSGALLVRARDVGAAAHRLAHPGRRHCLRRRRDAAGRRRRAVQPGDRFRHIDGRHHRDADAGDRGDLAARRGSGFSLRRSSYFSFVRRRRWAKAIAGSPSTCWASTRRFYGILQQTGAALGLAAAWLLSDAVTRQPITRVLLWLTIIGAVLSLPTIALVIWACTSGPSACSALARAASR